jgi:hypothetical protein
VQPLVAAFTLYHWLALVCAMANTPRAVGREAAAIRRRCCETFGARRAIEGVGERIITTVAMGRGGVVEISRGLRPTLIVRLQSVSRGTF